MEDITAQAVPLLSDHLKPEQIEDDWITHFFDKCRIVSDKEMQRLWAEVLAGEANTPGSFSRKTVNLVADLNKSDAELFARLLGFAWMIGVATVLIFDSGSDPLSRYALWGMTFDKMRRLASLGLIDVNSLSGYSRPGLPKKCGVFYYLNFRRFSDGF